MAKINTKTPDSLDDETIVLVDNNEAKVLDFDDDTSSHQNETPEIVEDENAIEYKINPKVKTKSELRNDNILLSVRNLKQFFFFGKGPGRSKLKAVNNVSFDIREGECFGLVGESGCGKTTTGRSIIRLYNITSGSIYYKGYRISAGDRWNRKEIKYTKIRLRKALADYRKEAADQIAALDPKAVDYKEQVEQIRNEESRKAFEKKRQAQAIISTQRRKISQIKFDNAHVNKKLMREIQMIFQDPVDSLDPRMTVEDIIQEGLRIKGHHNKAKNHQKVVEMLEKVGLVADHASRYPHEFSGGQRQRIGIARALVMEPKLLICDEPISALDVSIRAQIINLLNELKEDLGLTMLFIAHDLSVVKYFCDRIGVMYFGKMVELASSDELFKHPLHPYTRALLSAIPKPDPLYERKRKRITYNPATAHDYSVDKPQFVEIIPGHFVYCNEAEKQMYLEEIKALDENKITLEDVVEEKNGNINEFVDVNHEEASKVLDTEDETKEVKVKKTTRKTTTKKSADKKESAPKKSTSTAKKTTTKKSTTTKKKATKE